MNYFNISDFIRFEKMMRTHPNGKYIPKRSAQIKRKRREAKKR